MKRRLRIALAFAAAIVALWFAIDYVRERRDRAWRLNHTSIHRAG